ncbi:hypothetical protein GE061_000952 [Apolygus lucorum]|uniref:Dystroglycan 1 n=1 Tax=Apolygus lucorum TaxID=248454 RepID=A0A6A4KKV0_APOLU|nr:hypothetical protein GE061_000952 [Apolygus lucorum]
MRNHMMERRLLLLLLSLLMAIEVISSEIDFKFEHLKQQPLQRLWGIPDTTAQIGFLLHYQIARSAFDGSISRFKAYSENGDELPSWLIFHEKSGILEGVPSEENLGEYYITVEAFGENLQGSVKDVFALEVLTKTSSHFSHVKTDCKQTEEKTILSLVLDADFSTLPARQKVFILKNWAEFLNVKKELIFMSHIVEKNEIVPANVIDAGPGNIIQRSTRGPATILSLQIGCNGNVWKKFTDCVDLVKANSKNGELAAILHSPVIGWKLTREESDYRKRRETHGNLIEGFLDENSSGGAPEPRVVVENTETPVFQIDPSPTHTMEPLPATHKRRHHRGEPFSEIGLASSVMATPTYHPDRPSSIPSTLGFEPVETSFDISPTAVVEATGGFPSSGGFTPSTASYVDNATSTFDETEGSSSPSSPSSSYGQVDGSSSTSGEPTPTLPGSPTPFEEVVIDTKNFPPNIGQRLKKLPITAGKVLRYKIPEEAFSDLEDGSTKDLTIKLLTSEGAPLADNSWIQFNNDTKEIYALPLEEHVSRWVFTLKAVDSGGLSTEDKIEILVQNHKARRTLNHAFTAELISTPAGFTLDWQLNLLNAVSDTFGDPDTNYITVLSVSVDPPSFTWTNDSVSRSGCPTNEIENMQKILSNDDGLKLRVPSDLVIKKVSWSGLGHCETKTVKVAPEVPPKSDNLGPAPRNQVDHLNATIGQLLIFQVPEDTFYDPEDGNTRNMKLSLLTMNERARIPSNHWLQFDTKNQEFYGIPFTVGSTEYQLVCEDSGGRDASDVLVVTVQPAPRVMYNVQFSMTLAMEYNELMENPKLQRSFVEKLALVFGDPNTNAIVISGFAPGSTVVTWHNKTLPTHYCPENEILTLRQIMLGDDEKVTQSVLKVMAPEFQVISTKLTPTGFCQGALTEISTGNNEQAPNNDVTAVVNSEHYIIGLVIPALVIAVMLLCAGLVACILYRRKRTGKMSVGDEDDRQTFRSKGIPVIFQDELDERPEPTNKSPVIMKEEKPPLPPPEYHRGPPLATTALLSDTEDSPYQPPPPFTTSRDSARPKPTPTYRMPPPYVPP